MNKSLVSYFVALAISAVIASMLYVLVVDNVGIGYTTNDSWIPHALQYKLALSDKIHVPKIAVIGGSECLFSIDGEMLSRQTEMPVVNFGTHIGIPLRFYPEMLKGRINKGDVIVYSLAFNGQHNCGTEKLYSDLALPMYWSGLFPKTVSALRPGEIFDLYSKYGMSWISKALCDAKPRLSLYDDILEEYHKKHHQDSKTYEFYTYDEYGDKLYSHNCISEKELEESICRLLAESTEEFAFSMRRLRDFASSQGADLIVVMNNVFYYPHWSRENILLFEKEMRKYGISFNCNYAGLCFPSEYYLDTCLHLNAKGAKFLTYEIAKSINRALSQRNPSIDGWPVFIFEEHPEAIAKVKDNCYEVRCRKPPQLKSKSCIAYCLVDRLKQDKRNVVRSLAVNGVQSEVKERVKTVRNEIVFRFKSDNSDEFVMSFDLENDVRFERIIFDEAEDLDVFDFHLGGPRIKPVEGISPVFSRTNGCWTDGNKAIVKLQVQPHETERIRLQITFSTPRPNTITVSAGGEQLAIWNVPGGRTVERQVNVPSKYMTEDNWLPLEFDIETTICPAKEGISTDTRNLGMLMKTIKIVD